LLSASLQSVNRPEGDSKELLTLLLKDVGETKEGKPIQVLLSCPYRGSFKYYAKQSERNVQWTSECGVRNDSILSAQDYLILDKCNVAIKRFEVLKQLASGTCLLKRVD
jgi:hypothetical protein